jgi:3-hydroxyacyl-[acyl-carrier-protein] dehydratase
MNQGLEAALASLPHGAEFRFVDRLVELIPGKSGLGQYQVRGDEAFLQGHFPDNPLFPGVLLIEALAQLAGTVAQCDPDVPPLSDLKLTAVRSAKITGTARPGDAINLRAEVTGRMGKLVQAHGVAEVNGSKVLQADVVLAGR